MPTAIDLFTGLGGWSTGARDARHLVIWAASHWPVAVEKRSLIVRKARDQALVILGERHGFQESQETVSTLIINLAAAPAADSKRFASMSRRNW